MTDLFQTARAMVASGRGILAADECPVTMASRFAGMPIENTEETRRKYRTLAFSAPGLSEYVSAVILHEETLDMAELVSRQGMIPGINVDKGLVPLGGSPAETVTEGLDGLRERLAAYQAKGARFAKWRALVAVDDSRLPTAKSIDANVHALARYAALCQEAGLVPIVEPEVAMSGSHTAERCAEVTERVLRAQFQALALHDVQLEGIVLKPNMCVAGLKCPVQPEPSRIAALTIDVLKRTVPAAVPAIAFLSGGQSEADATERLSAINLAFRDPPWQLGFAYGRALQGGAFKAFGDGLGEGCQRALLSRAKKLGAARYGRYERSMELQ